MYYKLTKNKKIVIGIMMILVICFSNVNAYSSDKVENISFTAIVNTNTLNVRQGPGTEFDIITRLKKDDIVDVIGKFKQWYIIRTQSNIFGLCNEKYLDDIGEYSTEITILNEINEQRESKKIKKLTLDSKLSEIAKIKAQDIIDNNYFSHYSQTLGTPIQMLNKHNINFMTVGENIAKNNDINELIMVVTQNDSYKSNSMSNDYNYTGISILPIDEYNYVFVQLFVGRQ